MTNITLRTNSISKLDNLDYILLDGSGSMKGKWWPMLEAIDTYVAGLKESKVATHLKLQIFDSFNMNQVVRDCHINDWKTFAQEPVGAHFTSTPLFDAIAKMVQQLRDLNPGRASILIVTDGEENASKFADLTQAKNLLDWCRAHGWQVTFMGCDFNNFSQAQLLGASAENTIGVQKALLSDATKSFAKKRTQHHLYGTDINFTKDEQTQFGGYLGTSA